MSDTTRYKTKFVEAECSHCEWTGETNVEIDTLAGVAGFSCPRCGRQQEA